MNKELEAIEYIKDNALFFEGCSSYEYSPITEDKKFCEKLDIIETALKDYEKKLKTLEVIEENVKYGYVFIGYNEDNEPLFQFADPELYEEIKKNMILLKKDCYE